jgi:hypothetical protein
MDNAWNFWWILMQFFRNAPKNACVCSDFRCYVSCTFQFSYRPQLTINFVLRILFIESSADIIQQHLMRSENWIYFKINFYKNIGKTQASGNWWWIVLVYGFTGLHFISNILLTAYHSGLRVYRLTSNFKFKTINSGLQVYRFTSNFKFNYEFLFIGLQVISNSVLIYRFTGFCVAL